MNANGMKRRAVLAGGAMLLTLATVGGALAQDPMTIGVAMPFRGNGWQDGFLAAAEWARDELNAKGSNVQLFVVDAAGDPQTQIQQLNNMILQGVDFIILEPLSDTALNGAIDNAVNAGIPVLATALGSVTNPRAIDLQQDYDELGRVYIENLARIGGGKGKALNIRGLAGNSAEQAIQNAYVRALADHPDIEIVAEVYGDWNQSVSQQRVAAILPTLPEVDMIISQGVAAFGAAQAFQAAGREVPKQVYGFDGLDVNLLLQLNEQSGYDSVAINSDPGVGALAVYVAHAKLSGVEVPMKMSVPVPVVGIDELRAEHADMADSEVMWVKHGYDWVLSDLIGAK
ncbi:substrate-binding domain-containing protein [Paracoccus pantotrophus]|mgnify:CR=1 FL=1|uniref:Substrate-binding domain-containing protein n=1 Tax=Paracoccus pantotrophus TaxID=82367 RepID=A0A7H9BQL9_PARPN|nr:substrate-binding domain-containing protein [Paracoccus pantotrophus]QLH13018.1 substrate-binding domain-containing protein [Paracoccus pantotrophus]